MVEYQLISVGNVFNVVCPIEHEQRFTWMGIYIHVYSLAEGQSCVGPCIQV